MGDLMGGARWIRQQREDARSEQERRNNERLERLRYANRIPQASRLQLNKFPRLPVDPNDFILSGKKYIILPDCNAYFAVLLCNNIECAKRAEDELKLLNIAFITYRNESAHNVYPVNAWAVNYDALLFDLKNCLKKVRMNRLQQFQFKKDPKITEIPDVLIDRFLAIVGIIVAIIAI